MYKFLYSIYILCFASQSYAESSSANSSDAQVANSSNDANRKNSKKRIILPHSKYFALKLSKSNIHAGNLHAIVHLEFITIMTLILQHMPIGLFELTKQKVNSIQSDEWQTFSKTKIYDELSQYGQNLMQTARQNATQGYWQSGKKLCLELLDNIYIEDICIMSTLNIFTNYPVQGAIGVTSLPFKKLFMITEQEYAFLKLSELPSKGFLRFQYGIMDIYINASYFKQMTQTLIRNAENHAATQRGDIISGNTNVNNISTFMNIDPIIHVSLIKTFMFIEAGILFKHQKNLTIFEFKQFNVQFFGRVKFSLLSQNNGYRLACNIILLQNIFYLESLAIFVSSKILSKSELYNLRKIVSNPGNIAKSICDRAGIHIVTSFATLTLSTDEMWWRLLVHV